MATHALDIAVFRATFPAFADATTYPDPTVQLYWNLGTGYISADDGGGLNGSALQAALNFMAAHLLFIFGTIAATGQGPMVVVVTGSDVDKVAVTLEPPPAKNGWQFWLSASPYGLSLWALLSARAAGGFFVAGRPERAAFRKVGGRF